MVEAEKSREKRLSDERYVKRRYLDPANPKSATKDFYSSSILQVFDTHYTKHQ